MNHNLALKLVCTGRGQGEQILLISGTPLGLMQNWTTPAPARPTGGG